jgi:hypothetical protein
VLHVLRHRAGDQQQVGVARAGDELDAVALEVGVGIVQRVDLQLAAVAGAGVDRADGQRAAEDAQDLVAHPAHFARHLARGRSAAVSACGGSLTMPVRRMRRSMGITGRLRCRTG